MPRDDLGDLRQFASKSRLSQCHDVFLRRFDCIWRLANHGTSIHAKKFSIYVRRFITFSGAPSEPFHDKSEGVARVTAANGRRAESKRRTPRNSQCEKQQAAPRRRQLRFDPGDDFLSGSAPRVQCSSAWLVAEFSCLSSTAEDCKQVLEREQSRLILLRLPAAKTTANR